MSMCDNCSVINTIFKGDDTYFNGTHTLHMIELVPEAPLTTLEGFTAKFIFQGIVQSFNDLTQPLQPVFTKEQTLKFQTGLQYATLIIYDTSGQQYHVFTNLAYNVITKRGIKCHVNNN